MKIQLRWILAPLLAVGLFPVTGLQAQLVCSGTACSALPINNAQLDQMFQSLQTQYLDEVLQDMSDATVIGGVQLSPSGMVNLREFTIGMQLVAGAKELRELNVYVPKYGLLEDMPSAGISAVPRIFIGFNLGYMLSGEPGHWTDLSPFSLYRFDVYVSGLNMSLTEMKEFAKPKENEDYGGFSKSIGAEIRYHLIEGGDRGASLFTFTGMSLGFGYNRVEQKLQYTRSNSEVKIKAGSGTTIIWDAEDRISYSSKMDVFPVSLRTGFQFLYFLRLSLGAGVAWSRGSSSLELRRNGRAYVDSDYAALLGLSFPDSYLDLTITGAGGPSEPRQAFATAGLEFNIPFLKIFVDAAGNERMYSASAGLRMVF